jgi:hypothetical protein
MTPFISPCTRLVLHQRPRPGGSLACILTGGLLVALGCASGGGNPATRGAGCGLRTSDSVYAARGPVYRDCAVDSKASLLVANPRIDFQPPPAATACYSAELEFVVDTNGTPEMQTALIVRATDQAFGQAVLTAVAGWRYKPAMRDGHRVRQIVEDRRMAQTMVVAVRAGSPPPSGPPPRTALPRC